MKTSKQRAAISAFAILGTLLCTQCAVSTGNASDNCDDDVDFKIVTDRTEYSPGSPLRVTAFIYAGI